MTVRRATYGDIPRIMEICSEARGIMRANGNMSQWTGEQTYLKIEGGHWLDDAAPYCTIHRLASTKRSHGIARACFDWCRQQCGNLRIDTHEDNRIMRHCIEKYGFAYCGVIHLLDGSPRLAFQKIGNAKRSLFDQRPVAVRASVSGDVGLA